MINSLSKNDWIEAEFNGIELGDQRLNQRFLGVTKGLASHSEKTISSSFESWKEIKGCYRFFSNEKVKSEAIRAPHKERIISRVREEKRVLFIQDTVIFSYGERPSTSNLGLCSTPQKNQFKD